MQDSSSVADPTQGVAEMTRNQSQLKESHCCTIREIYLISDIVMESEPRLNSRDGKGSRI